MPAWLNNPTGRAIVENTAIWGLFFGTSSTVGKDQAMAVAMVAIIFLMFTRTCKNWGE